MGYGTMMGVQDALDHVEEIWNMVPESEKTEKSTEKYTRMKNRFSYECSKGIPVKPKGEKHRKERRMMYTCGHCGHGIDVINNYCPNCGFMVKWDSPRCLTKVETKEEI